MAKRPYNKKPKAETLKEESRAVHVPCVPLDKIQELTEKHQKESEGRIKFHLQKVKENTGEVLPEDTAYIMNLSAREFWYKLKQEAI
jgi:hypothetical protein